VTAAHCARQCGSGDTGWPTSDCSRSCRSVKQRWSGCSNSSGRRKLLLATAPVGDVADWLLQLPVSFVASSAAVIHM
jgi:hypothetical protein